MMVMETSAGKQIVVFLSYLLSVIATCLYANMILQLKRVLLHLCPSSLFPPMYTLHHFQSLLKNSKMFSVLHNPCETSQTKDLLLKKREDMHVDSYEVSSNSALYPLQVESILLLSPSSY